MCLNLQCNSVARQVEEKCCPFYRTLKPELVGYIIAMIIISLNLQAQDPRTQPRRNITLCLPLRIISVPFYIKTFNICLLSANSFSFSSQDYRSNTEEFPEFFPSGVFEAVWWAAVTMTTVGYVAVLISVRLVAYILCKCSLVFSIHRQTVKSSIL